MAAVKRGRSRARLRAILGLWTDRHVVADRRRLHSVNRRFLNAGASPTKTEQCRKVAENPPRRLGHVYTLSDGRVWRESYKSYVGFQLTPP